MKVFATERVNGTVKLTEFSSKRAFEQSNSWIDDKFIFIATSEDFKSGSYSDKHSNYVAPQRGHLKSLTVIYSPDQLAANHLLCNAAAKYLNKEIK